ncbi:MAG: NAD-dependent epimerase/dehydratase family protein [Candidatus Buchananbacteria bacterium]
MKILVTGGAGFIGSNLVDALIEQGHEVSVVDNLSTGQKNNLNPRAKFFELDITDKKLSEVFVQQSPEVVFHLAAQIDVRKSVSDPISDAQINILGSLNLLECCKKFKVGKIIFSSTGGAIYGDANIIPTPETYEQKPISPYGICKLSVEKYLHYYHVVFGLPYIVLRYANVYGPRQNAQGEAGVVAIFCSKLLAGSQPTIWGAGQQTRDYVYVADVVAANLAALNFNKVATYNVGTGIETNVNELAEQIKNNIGTNLEFVHGPAKDGEQQRSCLDYSKIKNELGWLPQTTLAQGIGATVDWFRK